MGGEWRIGDMELPLRRFRLGAAVAAAAVAAVAVPATLAAGVIPAAAADPVLRRLLVVSSGARRRRFAVAAFGLAVTVTSPEPVPEVSVLLLSLVWPCG